MSKGTKGNTGVNVRHKVGLIYGGTKGFTTEGLEYDEGGGPCKRRGKRKRVD